MKSRPPWHAASGAGSALSRPSQHELGSQVRHVHIIVRVMLSPGLGGGRARVTVSTRAGDVGGGTSHEARAVTNSAQASEARTNRCHFTGARDIL
ncbi:MAG: hypothetical protein EXR75_03350 [Myxococcales bacterium]|nr:hypothetical protein [Myxococcales bacterium]